MTVRDDNQPLGTSFLQGLQFRTFKKLTLAAGATWTFRMVRPVDVFITEITLHVKDGEVNLLTYRGGTPSGTWSELLPVLPRNETNTAVSLPRYTAQTVFEAGGTVTGGELRDAMDVKAANATAQASTIGVNTGDQRGYPGNTIGYYVFTNPGAQTANVVIHVSWEEVI